ncbi:VanZ family protein [Anaerocellum danielii]|uniref:VanZ family protein n=1 Tax=Anaerocellum danielii TaxID=1387557 RepID=A0ABZ0TZK6_9FIRM|nr:VanZ family protein [Caldicellulosiruptor danielii]WPX08491.1 VanZ family protein [Caldicellulosiruptor danielii]
MLIIFSLSSQPAKESNELSKSVTKQIIKATQKVGVPNVQIEPRKNIINKLNDVVREYAHAMVYLVLGILVANAFVVSGIKGSKSFLFFLLFCILYAITDEIHQLFVPGRGTEVYDVLIDGIGALIGIGLYKFIFKIYHTLKPKP